MKIHQSARGMVVGLFLSAVPVAYVQGDVVNPGVAPGQVVVPTTTQVVPVQVMMVSGLVTNLDQVNQTIQIKDVRGQLQTITVNSGIEIVRNDEIVSMNSLSLNDSIVIKILSTNR